MMMMMMIMIIIITTGEMSMQKDNMLYEINYVVESNNQYDMQMSIHNKTEN